MVLTHSHAAGEKKVWMFGSRLRRSAEPDGDRDPDPEGPEPSRAAFLRAAAAARRRAANAANTATFQDGSTTRLVTRAPS